MLGGGGAGKTEAESWENVRVLGKGGSSFSQGLSALTGTHGPGWAAPGPGGPSRVPPLCWGWAEGPDLGWGPGGVGAASQ